MEDQAQKMEALKKAYAEIILNTAKEAAARVMQSERKALRFQHDLRATKDEALRMLTRFKQLIDSKTAEAEMTSLNQQRKIDELEAQLNEAEDVIADLRTEVKHVWDKLEKVKRSQAKALNGRIRKEDASSRENTAAQLMIPPPPSSSASETVTTSDLKNAPLDQKSKEPEPYINGFTQRIHACERNLPDGIVPTSGDVGDHHSPEKNELTTKMIHKEEGKCPVPSTRTIIMKIMKNSTREEVKKPVKVRTSRRRRNRFGKVKANSRKSRPGHLMKPCQQSSILSSGKPHSINGFAKSAEGACTIPSIKADKEEFKTVHKGEGKNEMKSGDGIATIKPLPDQLSKPCQSFSVLSCCRTFSHSVNGNVKSGEDRLRINEIESKIKPLTRLDPGLTLIKRDINPRLGSTNLTVSMKATKKSGLIQNAVEDTKMDDSELGKHKGDTADNLMHPSPELNVGTVNIPLMNSDLKDAEVSDDTKGYCQSDNNRLLKYTFQRKRKKESLGNLDESVPLEKRRAGENQSGAPELQDSSLNNESSRDGRRLAQVARQLVSLSGRRWW
ncbi:hypothetical protein ACB098_01G280600 [Castanea mollissima]|uniref:Uncharacterized protein n=1 Tax=Castanea mollissima TaxID=60419 RepID=A0A8J4VD79_9ROSI|nr:hypothetical protein CMV_023717 [Castanea mollissima]